MSKMSQLHMELTESAIDWGYSSIEDAEEHGLVADYSLGKFYRPYTGDEVNESYKALEEEEKKEKEAKQIELVCEAIGRAKDMIALIYKPEGVPYCNAIKHITDEKIKDYYYTLNSMCCELMDRGVMAWQREEELMRKEKK